MIVIDSKNDKVTIGEIVDNFDKYIVVLDNRKVLMKLFGTYSWVDPLTNEIFGEYNNISIAVQDVDISSMRAFKNFKGYAIWLDKVSDYNE